MIVSFQPDLLRIYWWGKYNIYIYAAYIFIKFLVGVLYKKMFLWYSSACVLKFYTSRAFPKLLFS